jgi:hypothetical protein
MSRPQGTSGMSGTRSGWEIECAAEQIDTKEIAVFISCFELRVYVRVILLVLCDAGRRGT